MYAVSLCNGLSVRFDITYANPHALPLSPSMTAAQGPGADFPNAKLFQVMMNAYGWPISR